MNFIFLSNSLSVINFFPNLSPVYLFIHIEILEKVDGTLIFINLLVIQLNRLEYSFFKVFNKRVFFLPSVFRDSMGLFNSFF